MFIVNLPLLALATASSLGPQNDDCSSAIPVLVPSVTAGSTVGASSDPAAGPACGTSITVGGVWYSVTGTGNTITATTCAQNAVQPGSADFNSKLSIFCNTCEALSCVGGNDNGCGFFFQSTVSWCSEVGVEYLILVHGDDEQGNFELSVYDGPSCDNPPDCTPPPTGACCFPGFTCVDASALGCEDAGGVFQGEATECATFDCLSVIPRNDSCTGAEAVAVPSVTEGSTLFASVDSVIFCNLFINAPGVWYTVTGTGSTITATTCSGDPVQPGSGDFDTQLTVYCGSCNTSSCCSPNGGAGCDDSTCQDLVCSVDLFCCNVFWDDICVSEAVVLCPDLCQPVYCVTDNDDECETDSLLSTASWCSEVGRTYYVLVTGFNEQTGNFALSVYDDGAACENPVDCEPCVFECAPGNTVEDEPNCGIPQDTTNGGCDAPVGAQSSCCTAQATAGCDDPACTLVICGMDSFCCDTQWDQICAATAIELCASCANLSYPMTPISCGETYCSTAASNGSMRDVDWYKLVLEEDALVEVSVKTSFPAIFTIDNTGGVDTCAGLTEFVTFAIAQACEPSSIFANLSAGTWYMEFAPANFDFLPCPTEYEFTVTCSQPGACCFADGSCFQRGESQCAEEGGTYLGFGTDCFDLNGEISSSTSAPELPIPDGDLQGVSDTITIDDSLVIGKLTVDLTINHSWISDLVVTLTHEPTQTSAVLWRTTCDGAPNLDVTLDDDGGDVTCGARRSGSSIPWTQTALR